MMYLDTNILIYLLEQHDRYSQQVARILEEFTENNRSLVTSVVTITEFLAGTDSSSLITLRQVPNLLIIPLVESLAEESAVLLRKYKIQIGDSIHLATAIQQHAECFFTNDKKLAEIVKNHMTVVSLDPETL